MRNHGNLLADGKGKVARVEARGRNTDAASRGGALRTSVDASVMGAEQRERVVEVPKNGSTSNGRNL
jgi:hypothetical protein